MVPQGKPGSNTRKKEEECLLGKHDINKLLDEQITVPCCDCTVINIGTFLGFLFIIFFISPRTHENLDPIQRLSISVLTYLLRVVLQPLRCICLNLL